MPEAAARADAGTTIGRHAVHVMGTVVSFDLRDPVPSDALDHAAHLLHRADEVFSMYRADSEMSRASRGELRIQDCDPDIEEVLALCRAATSLSEGYFTAFPFGHLDPTGLVKGWAVQRASDVLTDAGSLRHAVNGGGDVHLVGRHRESPVWRIGISDPTDPSRLIAVAGCREGGIATSGIAERGHHIVNPRSGQRARVFASVTVTAGALIDADVLATAAFARGRDAIDWIEQLPGIEAFFVMPDGSSVSTSEFPHV
jgi:thiamine biosynthesis lipoprotein